LNRLLRVKIVSFRLVGEIETWPDNGNAAGLACDEHARGRQRRERLFDGEVRQERGVRRQAPSAKEPRPDRELGAWIRRDFRGLERPHEIIDLSNDAPHHVQQKSTNGGVSVRRLRIDVVSFDQAAGELQTLVRARRRNAGDQVVDALAQDLRRAVTATELRAVVQGARMPASRRATHAAQPVSICAGLSGARSAGRPSWSASRTGFASAYVTFPTCGESICAHSETVAKTRRTIARAITRKHIRRSKAKGEGEGSARVFACVSGGAPGHGSHCGLPSQSKRPASPASAMP